MNSSTDRSSHGLRMSTTSKKNHGDENFVDDKDEWNAAAFDERVSNSEEWKADNGKRRSSKSKKPTRVQDISVSVDSSRHQNPAHACNDENQKWPFENSPCRMFGGKNTKQSSEADAINKEYFDPNFVEHSKRNPTYFDDNEEAGQSSSDLTCSSEEGDVRKNEQINRRSFATESDLGSHHVASTMKRVSKHESSTTSMTKPRDEIEENNAMDIDEYDYGYDTNVGGANGNRRMTSAASLREQQMKAGGSGNRNISASVGPSTSTLQSSNAPPRNMILPRRGSTGGGPIAGYVGTGGAVASSSSRSIFSIGGRRSSVTGTTMPASTTSVASSNMQRSSSVRFGRRSSVDCVSSNVSKMERSSSVRVGRRSSLDFITSGARALSSSRHGDLNSTEEEEIIEKKEENAASTSKRPFGIRFRLSRSSSQPNISKSEQQQYQLQTQNKTGSIKSSNGHDDDIDDESPKRKTDLNVERTSSKHQRRQANDAAEEVDDGIAQQRPYAQNASSEDAVRNRSSEKASSSTRVSRRSSTGGSTGLDAVTYHGDPSNKASRASSSRVAAPTSRRSTGLSRHKSSDDPSVMMPSQSHGTSSSSQARRSSRNDDLGTATLHGTGGKSAVSRIRRTSTKTSTSGNDNGQMRQSRRGSTTGNGGEIDRRAKFKRAMSTENVRRPEEYGPDGGRVTAAPEETVVKRRGGRRSTISQPTQQQKQHHTMEDKESGTSSSSSEGDNVESDEDSFADEGDVEQYRSRYHLEEEQQQKHLRSSSKASKVSTHRSGNAQSNRRSEHQVSSSSQKKEGEARDVLELLHESKSMKLRDMQDKDNRSIIHFLLFEHKMGVSLAQMKKSIEQDILEDPDEALRRLPLPLYVAEPAN